MRFIYTFLFIFVIYTGTALAAPFVYVTDFEQDNVVVIDAASNTIITTIDVGDGPANAIVNPSGNTVYVGSLNVNRITFIDVTNQQVFDDITLDNPPAGMAFAPDGSALYITVPDSNSVVILGISPNDPILGTVEGLDSPFAIAITPDGTRAYVANRTSVSVIDTASMQITDTIENVNVDLEDIVIDPQGNFAYVSNANPNGNAPNAGQLDIIDLSTNQVSGSVDLAGPTGDDGNVSDCYQFTSDGSRMYGVWAAPIVGIDIGSNAVDQVIGSDFLCSAIHPNDDTLAYAITDDSDTVVLVNLAVGTTPVTIPIEGDEVELSDIVIASPSQGDGDGGSNNGSCALAAQGSSSNSLFIFLVIPAVILVARIKRKWN